MQTCRGPIGPHKMSSHLPLKDSPCLTAFSRVRDVSWAASYWTVFINHSLNAVLTLVALVVLFVSIWRKIYFRTLDENFKAHCVTFQKKILFFSLPAGLAKLLLDVFIFEVNFSHRKIFLHFLLSFLHYSSHYVEMARELFYYPCEPPADWNNYVVIWEKGKRLFQLFLCYCSQFSSRSRQHKWMILVGVQTEALRKIVSFLHLTSAGWNHSVIHSLLKRPGVQPWLLSLLVNDGMKRKTQHLRKYVVIISLI